MEVGRGQCDRCQRREPILPAEKLARSAADRPRKSKMVYKLQELSGKPEQHVLMRFVEEMDLFRYRSQAPA